MSRPGDAQPWVNFGGHFLRTDTGKWGVVGERFTMNVGGDSMDLTEKRRKHVQALFFPSKYVSAADFCGYQRSASQPFYVDSATRTVQCAGSHYRASSPSIMQATQINPFVLFCLPVSLTVFSFSFDPLQNLD